MLAAVGRRVRWRPLPLCPLLPPPFQRPLRLSTRPGSRPQRTAGLQAAIRPSRQCHLRLLRLARCLPLHSLVAGACPRRRLVVVCCLPLRLQWAAGACRCQGLRPQDSRALARHWHAHPVAALVPIAVLILPLLFPSFPSCVPGLVVSARRQCISESRFVSFPRASFVIGAPPLPLPLLAHRRLQQIDSPQPALPLPTGGRSH